MSYTPRPWIVHKEGHTRTHIISEDVEDTRLIASVYSDARHPEVAENLALIAAAPDLYEAAKVCLVEFKEVVEEYPGYKTFLSQLEDAVTKAGGREP